MSALKKAELSPQGVTHTDALHVITAVKGDPRKRVIAIVDSYVDQAKYEAGNASYCQRGYTLQGEVDPSLGNLWSLIKLSDENSGFFKTGTTDVGSITHP